MALACLKFELRQRLGPKLNGRLPFPFLLKSLCCSLHLNKLSVDFYIPCEARAVRTIPAPGDGGDDVRAEPPSVAYGLGVTRRPCSALQCSYAHSFFRTTPSHA